METISDRRWVPTTDDPTRTRYSTTEIAAAIDEWDAAVPAFNQAEADAFAALEPCRNEFLGLLPETPEEVALYKALTTFYVTSPGSDRNERWVCPVAKWQANTRRLRAATARFVKLTAKVNATTQVAA